MKYVVMLHTSDYRGDHAADVCAVHEAKDGETVHDLVHRLLRETNEDEFATVKARYEYIEIRPVVEAAK